MVGFNVQLGLSVVLFLACVGLGYYAFELNVSLDATSKTLSACSTNYQGLQVKSVEEKQALESTVVKLEEKNALLYSNNSNIQKDLSAKQLEAQGLDSKLSSCTVEKTQLKEGLTKVVTEVNSYEKELSDRMSWFSRNLDLNQFQEFDSLKSPLKSHCMVTDGSKCTIKLPCIPFINKNQGQIEYKTNLVARNASTVNYLPSLDQVLSNGGSDCKGLSLLFAAELSYLMQQCNTQNVELEAMGKGALRYLIAYDWNYYYPNFDAVSLDEKRVYPVCGILPDDYSRTEEYYSTAKVDPHKGHCVVALTNKTIAKSDDVYDAIAKSMLVEPQTGEFLVDLNEKRAVQIPETKITKSFYANVVMTNNDLYEFNEEWKGYAFFVNRLQGLKAVG